MDSQWIHGATNHSDHPIWNHRHFHTTEDCRRKREETIRLDARSIGRTTRSVSVRCAGGGGGGGGGWSLHLNRRRSDIQSPPPASTFRTVWTNDIATEDVPAGDVCLSASINPYFPPNGDGGTTCGGSDDATKSVSLATSTHSVEIPLPLSKIHTPTPIRCDASTGPYSAAISRNGTRTNQAGFGHSVAASSVVSAARRRDFLQTKDRPQNDFSLRPSRNRNRN